MPTFSATFKRIDSGDRNEDEKSMEITFSRDCCVGRSNFSALNKKIARKHVELKFGDEPSQEGPFVMIKSVSKNPAFYWKKLKSDTTENSNDYYSSADQVSRDEYLPLKSGDKFGVFENSFIYTININKNPTPISAQSSLNLSQKCEDDRSTSPTPILNPTQEFPDDDLDSETDYGSETEKEIIKDEEISENKSETLEKESTDVTPKCSSPFTELVPERKRMLPNWMLLTHANSNRANDQMVGSRPTRRAAKNRRLVDYDEEFLDDEDETPAHSTRARRASKQEQPSSHSRTRSGGTKLRGRADQSNEDGGSAEEYDEDEEPEHSPVRNRQKRAAAVRISSYAESEFVVNGSDFSDSDVEEKSKKRRKTESDEEYEDEPNEANNDSGSEFEISQSPNKAHRKSSSSPHRKGANPKSGRRRSSHKNRSGGGGQRSRSEANKNSGRPPASSGGPIRRSSRRKMTQSDDENDECDEKNEENKYIIRSSASRSASNSVSPAKSPEKSGRQACVYGAKCYRKNALHKKDYSHPGDPDWVKEEEKPEKRPSRNIRPKRNADFVNSSEEVYYSSGQESEEVDDDDDSKDVDYGSRANRNRASATSKKRPSNQDEDNGEELQTAKKRPLKRSRR